MNILIVGNGYDLSHYLPTKYDHFMAVMQAVQNWDVSKGDMQFDDLFSSLYESESKFFGYTKAMYDTSGVKLTVAEIKNLKEQLEQNVWYQYFLQHVREVKTWIDFETKMAEALELISEFFIFCENEFKNNGKLSFKKSDLKGFNQNKIKKIAVLNLILNYDKAVHMVSEYYEFIKMNHCNNVDILNINFFVTRDGAYGFDFSKYQLYLIEQHKQFVDILNFYLMQLSTLVPYKPLQNSINSRIDKIYSFNYTSSAQNFYGYHDIDYIHGQIGEKNNIVLGVSDLEEIALKNFKMYGFTKYHQKLLHNTDYVFLSEIKIRSLYRHECIENYFETEKVRFKSSDQVDKSNAKERLDDSILRVIGSGFKQLKEIFIWGHSLDVSDQDYIKELFSFNKDNQKKKVRDLVINLNIKIKIFYFNDQAKFDLLSNLLHILGKEKVETWMKNKWLIFEPNPNIAELNGITPMDLSCYQNTASA